MTSWNCKSHHLSSEIVGKIVKYQYLSSKSIGFRRPFSPEPKNPKKSRGFFWKSKIFSWIFLGFRDPRADRAARPPHDCKALAQNCTSPSRPALPCPRAHPHAPPPNLRFYAILSEISKNHGRKLRCLALNAFKTHHKMITFSGKCSKHVVKWHVEIKNLNTSRLKS